MHLIEFTATMYVSEEFEDPDYDVDLDDEDAKDMAVKRIRMTYPEYDNIEIINVKEV